MTHQIIKTENYLLVVDESEIKVRDWYLRYNSLILKCTKLELKFNEALGKEETIISSNGCGDPYERSKSSLKKIIYHLPINNAPILEGVPLLPPLEDDESICPYPEEKQNAVDWHNGYNKAKERYKYTEEDMRKAFQCGQQWVHEITNTDKDPTNFNELIQSLQQPKFPVAFECEMAYIVGDINNFDDWVANTITNSQGQIELVGKYIFTN